MKRTLGRDPEPTGGTNSLSLFKRAVVIVLDSLGVGELPDAGFYGDEGSNTLLHTAEAVGGLNLPNLAHLGLGNIISVPGVDACPSPKAHYGKMAEKSAGKDTTVGHWELMGVITENPFPTYPNGFPPDLIAEFENRIGRKTLGNRPASGTEIINELGERHIETGFPIVYTSADSVFQIACHEEVVPVEELYRMCMIARELLVPPHNVQRVIARPFVGKPGAFVRTERRKDFSLQPPSDTLLDLVSRAGRDVVGIGKIEDIFAGRGLTESVHTANNEEGVRATLHWMSKCEQGLILTNLVDFDMLYGHRNDPDGYAKALEAFDSAVPRIMQAVRDEDVLVITADHGCDPTTPSTDHSREYVPLLVYTRCSSVGKDLGVRGSFSDLACTLADFLGIVHSFPGSSFAANVFTG
ncbi:MAG: phosphopentomutase [Armatimonadota bacterium]|nr:phosphopentomutase [Armatimonadota bacterium]